MSEDGEKRYDAWGEQRYTWGTTPTTFRYTGQRVEGPILTAGSNLISSLLSSYCRVGLTCVNR